MPLAGGKGLGLPYSLGRAEPAWAQRASRSGGSTPGVAPDRATRWVAGARFFSVGFVLGRVPWRPPSAFAARRGRRFRLESRYSLSVQAGRKSSARFSAPCSPHCGSAVAPPVPLGTRKLGVSAPKRRPRQFLPDWLSANRQNMPIRRAGDGFFALFFFRAPARFIYIWLLPK